MDDSASVHYVGVDLAWGDRSPTGLAVLDADARLVHLCAVTSDEEIHDRLRPFTTGACVVALDAPIVVTNATGSRRAEQELSRDFRRFEAGAHPANLGRAEFADGGRAARLCRRLGLDTNPRSGRSRRAIEVYPHAASVVLFALDKTLKYKAKPGRTVESLRSEMLLLIGHVEDLPIVLDETWTALRNQVDSATRKSELRVVEDQVDAVICAYVALVAETRGEEMTIYGDAETGAIVTPALRRERPGRVSDPVRAAVRDYAARRPALLAAGTGWVELIHAMLDEAGINYLSVTGRTKSVASFAEKAGRQRDGVALYPEPLTQIPDQVGVRVITYVHSDVAAVADLLGEEVVVTDDRDMGEETAAEGRFGYASRHLLIELDAARRGHPRWASVGGQVAQVQIRTVLQHAWAEFEHEARYKGHVPEEHAHDLDRRFTLAAGLLELADEQLSAIREKLRAAEPVDAGPEDADDPRLVPGELAAFLAGQYAEAGWSRSDHYDWISGLLLELGIHRFDELAEVLRAPELAELNERLGYRFPPGAVRRLDDALLAAHGERYITLTGNAHRVELLRTRLERMS